MAAWYLGKMPGGVELRSRRGKQLWLAGERVFSNGPHDTLLIVLGEVVIKG